MGWLALLLSIFAWAPLTYPGYFEFHSGFLPIFNLNDLARHLADLGPALAWTPTVGQPYDLWRGERALPYLLALLPRAMELSPAAAIKLIFAASIAGGALGLYGWARRRLGGWPGLTAAFVYALWPIGLATVYVRGAFAEAVFLGLMPWVWWAADAAREGRRWAAPALALTLAVAFWTQAGLALWLAVMALIYLFSSVARDPSLDSHRDALHVTNPLRLTVGAIFRTRVLVAWLAGVALGVLGLLPVILQRGLGGAGGWPVFADHFVYLHQLLQAGWGFGSSIAGPYDTLTFQLGLAACGLTVLGVVLWRPAKSENGSVGAVKNGSVGEWERRRPLPYPHTPTLSVTIVLILVFLSTTLAAPLWRILPFLARTLTYPWQLLLLAGPWLAWLAGLGTQRLLEWLLGAPPKRFVVTTSVVPRTTKRLKSPLQKPGAVSGQTPNASSTTLPLVAALLVLALLGSYDYLQPKTTHVPIPDAPLAIFGDNEIALLSAVTAGPPGPGGRVTALVRWQALRPLDHDYTVFFHAIGPDGKRWGQQDTMPQGNQLPTSQWRPGQVVTDQYQVLLAAGAPISNDYRYALGLYLWQTGQRLATGADDKVVLGP